MMTDRLRIAFAAGGTGGHVYPALAIASAVKSRRPDAEIVFFGTAGKIEERIVPREGYMLVRIWISGFHRSLRWDNILFPVKVLTALWQSWRALRRLRPQAVIGTGGYVCGPVLWVASQMGIPTVIHESNSYPGVTTRMLARRVTKLFLGFEDARAWLPKRSDIAVVGTPVRPGLQAKRREDGCRHFGLDASRPVVLVFGGSLGAASINRAIAGGIEELKKRGIQIIWQTGKTEADRLTQRFGDAGIGWVGGYIDTMDLAYAAADMVVCRAGASTLAELTYLGKPSVLVPYPHAAADHQTKNARSLANAGAAILVPDAVAGERLTTELLRVLGDARMRETMAAAARTLGRNDAAATIADQVLSLIG